MLLIWLIALILLILGIIEKRTHQIRINRIPIRIHVNGIRGKSLLTRIITDMFHQAGWSVAAKITGAKPEVFSADEGWVPWRRHTPPRIKEQMRFVREAARRSSQIMVVENMALKPENQYIAESQMIRSSLSVITNFHPDHQEVMGSTIEDMISALAFAFPKDGTLLMPEQEVTPLIQTKVGKLNSQLIAVKPSPELPSTDESVFASHFAILKEICAYYNLPGEICDQVVTEWQQRLRPENFLLPLVGSHGPRHFVDLFSCNDVTSAKQIIHWLEGSNLIRPPYDIILTCRTDRPLRTKAFLEWLLPVLRKGRLILAGGYPLLMVDRMRRRFGVPNRAIRRYTQINPSRILSELARGKHTVIGLGNFVGTGEKILSTLKKDLV